MRAQEFLSEIKLTGPDSRVRNFIDRVYEKFPATWQNNHVMIWGEGDDQQMAMFELVPSLSKKNAVEIKWFQAYPLRQGVGSRAMKILQQMAQEDGVTLTLYPWDRGQVSQAKLIKFYKQQGFAPNVNGSKNMFWEPTRKLDEGLAHPVIVVDVQPEYCGINNGNESPVCVDIIQFVAEQTGPVLMFVNAEDQGQTGDTVADVKLYWEDTVKELTNDYENEQPIDWSRFQIVDKGYGYFRTWMDQGVSPAAIIRVVRAMYLNRISDSRDFEDIDPELLPRLVGSEWDAWMYHDPIITNWTSIAQLKRFSGAYIVGGGRNECLREVELLMNSFNIRYKRIDSLVY